MPDIMEMHMCDETMFRYVALAGMGLMKISIEYGKSSNIATHRIRRMLGNKILGIYPAYRFIIKFVEFVCSSLCYVCVLMFFLCFIDDLFCALMLLFICGFVLSGVIAVICVFI